MGKTIQYPTQFDEQDARLRDELENSARLTGQSVNQLILACVRVALPRVVESLKPGAGMGTGRITNVDPLPDEVMDRLYREREEEDEAGVRLFIKAQAFGGQD